MKLWTKISLIVAWLFGSYISSFLTVFFGRNCITDTRNQNNQGQMILSPFHLINIFKSALQKYNLNVLVVIYLKQKLLNFVPTEDRDVTEV